MEMHTVTTFRYVGEAAQSQELQRQRKRLIYKSAFLTGCHGSYFRIRIRLHINVTYDICMYTCMYT